MKKILSCFLLIVCLCNVFLISAFAAEDTTPTVTVNADGSKSYANADGTTTTISPIREIVTTTPQTRGTVKTIAGAIDAYNCDTDTNEENWRYKLIGYFTYEEGVYSVCDRSEEVVTISDDWWHFSQGGSYWFDNAAYGGGRFEYKIFFITTQTVDVELRICCDTYGNFYS